ncbi:SET domain-containing protein 9 isoform X1 [Mauremys reevesii]|uniref:SET domain-containing protein 9 isoform X1 n=1 Tax=Mauremys reevesii TaxID=260615 RepID=UPI00193FEDB5|nr:SET domain-containing protein 9 isoform X1 [Mauremys reevesii]
MLRALLRRWASYRYRFVPWIALHLRHKRRTIRYVPEKSKDKIISDEDVLETLLKIFKALFINDFSRQMDDFALLPEVKSKYLKLLTIQYKRSKTTGYNHQSQNIFNPEEVLFNTLGFSITRDQSSLISAGTGVFVTKGFVPKGAVVSMYPGTVYQKYEPIFFQSIGNPFIFRCIDGVLIDGNDKGISKAVYSFQGNSVYSNICEECKHHASKIELTITTRKQPERTVPLYLVWILGTRLRLTL